MKTLLATISLLITCQTQLQSQDSLTPQQIRMVIAAADSIEKENSIIKFGVSVSGRWIFAGSGTGDGKILIRSATISPLDSTIRVDERDQGDIVISGVVTAFPFKGSKGSSGWRRFLSNLGFLANIDIASFTSESVTINNKSIEGEWV